MVKVWKCKKCRKQVNSKINFYDNVVYYYCPICRKHDYEGLEIYQGDKDSPRGFF